MSRIAAPDNKWPDAFLDQMRMVGDPLADEAVDKLFQSERIYSVWELMKKLVENDQIVPEELPPYLREYLEVTSRIPPFDPSVTAAGQQLFEAYGGEILMVLAFYSLPASYAARKGVQVLYRSGYLNNRANHRVFETTQMVMDVMSPGGLSAGARGVRSAQKVRLMHAATRRLILHDAENPWPEEFGIPINQEDLAGTLMVFTYLILEGLEKLGIQVRPEQKQGYLETWKLVARLMGVREELIPEDVAQARDLCHRIQERNVQVCAEGKAMTDALLEMTDQKLPPGPWRGWPAALMRHFLPAGIADGFAIPRHSLKEGMLRRLSALGNKHAQDEQSNSRKAPIPRRIAMRWIQALVLMELGGKRTPFVLPTNLHHGWAKSRLPSVWQQLKR